ncbi:hypothetical protein MBT84_19130 [Streptomyces sp. MBT84]|nr:hypothetical protein [Streptomyces sp. MBT84]
MLAAVAEHHRRADRGLDDQFVGLVAGQPEQDAGVRHGLDQIEEVRRTRAGQRGAGVLLCLGDAERLADGTEDLLGVGEVRLGGVASGRDDGHGLVDEGGRVRHDAHDRGAGGQARLEEGGGDAGGAADDQPVGGDVRGEFVEERAHVLRLDREDERVRGLRGLGVGDRGDAVATAEFLGSLLAAGRDQEVGGRPAAPDHAAEQRFADLSGAEDCDFLGHGASALRGLRRPGSSSHRVRRPGSIVRWADCRAGPPWRPPITATFAAASPPPVPVPAARTPPPPVRHGRTSPSCPCA